MQNSALIMNGLVTFKRQKFSLTAKLSNLKEWNGRNYTHQEQVECWSKEPLINLRQHLYFENFETHN